MSDQITRYSQTILRQHNSYGNCFAIVFNLPVLCMFSTLTTTLAVAISALMFLHPAKAATPVYKCVVAGKTTFQSIPCPSGVARPPPTAEQLNWEQKKRNEAAGATRLNQPTVGVDKAAVAQHQAPKTAASLPAVGTRCDGRKYCSQMTSCAEAKYFLASCPGTKMDGDGDGIPCEEQWCKQ